MTEKMTASGKRGRPAYRASLKDRRTVEQMKFVGESENTIARAIGIDPDTLRKHYAEELADGHAQRRKEVVGLLFGAARKGNVSAIKRLEEMGRIAGAVDAMNNRDTKAKPEKLGKKAERMATAEAAASDGIYAVPKSPRLVVNN